MKIPAHMPMLPKDKNRYTWVSFDRQGHSTNYAHGYIWTEVLREAHAMSIRSGYSTGKVAIYNENGTILMLYSNGNPIEPTSKKAARSVDFSR